MDFSLLVFGCIAFCLVPKSYAQADETDDPNTETYTFTSFSEVPQALLDELTSSEIEELKSELEKSRSGSEEIDYQIGSPGKNKEQPTTTTTTTTPGDKTNQKTNTYTFSSIGQIPESLYKELTSSEIDELKAALGDNKNGPTHLDFTINTSQRSQPAAATTPSDTNNQPKGNDTYVITSLSQIPESVYDELSSSEIEDLKYELSHRKSGPQTLTYEITTRGKQPRPQESNEPDNIYYIRYGDKSSSSSGESESISNIYEIPESIREIIPRYEIREIKRTLNNYQDIFHHLDISRYTERQINNLITIITSYINAGGYLSGIPPVDLLLLRIFLKEDPSKLCYSQGSV